MLNKKTVLFEESISIGEFDPSADGAYRNVKTFPLIVKRGRIFISADSDKPVDIALSDSDGICIKFKNSIISDTIGPIELTRKQTVTLMVGVYKGDKAELGIKVWME